MALSLSSAAETVRLGRLIGETVDYALLRLHGPLGAGKTTLVQGIAAGLGIPEEAGVRSPSFALVRIHEQGRLPLVHVDLYRLGDPDELEELGLDEWLRGRSVIAVEWADRFDGMLPDEGLVLALDYADDGGRRLELQDLGGCAALARSIQREFSDG